MFLFSTIEGVFDKKKNLSCENKFLVYRIDVRIVTYLHDDEISTKEYSFKIHESKANKLAEKFGELEIYSSFNKNILLNYNPISCNLDFPSFTPLEGETGNTPVFMFNDFYYKVLKENNILSLCNCYDAMIDIRSLFLQFLHLHGTNIDYFPVSYADYIRLFHPRFPLSKLYYNPVYRLDFQQSLYEWLTFNPGELKYRLENKKYPILGYNWNSRYKGEGFINEIHLNKETA